MSDPKTGDFPLPVAPSSEEPGRGVMAIEEFTALASKLVSFSMFKEAIGLYETAVKLYPENLAIKINLARVREMKRRNDERLLKELEDDIEEKRAREDLLSQHAFGLGHLHYRRGELERAREMFEFVRLMNPQMYLASLMLAKIHVGRNDLGAALAVLEDARKANPYSEDVQSLLARVAMEKGDNLKAIHALVDAVVLSGEPDVAHQPFYAQSLEELLRRLGYEAADIPAIVQERSTKFNVLNERIERIRRERQAAQAPSRLGSIFASLSQPPRPSPEALALRRFQILERASDEDLAALHRVLKREDFADQALIFSEQQSTRKLYFLDRGHVRVRRTTPFGDIVFAAFDPGQVFGEMDFLDGHGHSADALASGDASLLAVSHADAAKLFEARKGLSVQCLAYFWRSLSEHIRTTNEQMKTFFEKDGKVSRPALDEHKRAKAESVIVDVERKLALFREKGISANELKILATLSTEERYAGGDLIFAEGDAGSKLYIVLDGRVRITKVLPGVGEEALAILDRGDFFGEMALVDDKPRSADARAHEGQTTVLAIDKRVIGDILAQDPRSAEHLLSILCRILCQRLREINETIVKWKIMSGGF